MQVLVFTATTQPPKSAFWKATAGILAAGVLTATVTATIFGNQANAAFGTASTGEFLVYVPAPAATQPPAPQNGYIATHQVCQSAMDAAVSANWPPSLLRKVEKIAWRESRCQESAHRQNRNGTQDIGLMQINSSNMEHLIKEHVVSTPEDLFDPQTNMVAALSIYKFWHNSLCAWKSHGYCKR